jgi:hypothetical protein
VALGFEAKISRIAVSLENAMLCQLKHALEMVSTNLTNEDNWQLLLNMASWFNVINFANHIYLWLEQPIPLTFCILNYQLTFY